MIRPLARTMVYAFPLSSPRDGAGRWGILCVWTIFLGAELHPEFGRDEERAHRAKAYEKGVVSYSVSAGAEMETFC